MDSLHCIICVEQFDLKERQPVVLPCGHTYVCIICAKKIRRCMECREPLYWKPPQPPQNSNPRYGRYSAAPQTPPHPSYLRGQPNAQQQEQIPLPLPKNLVLMEMIEDAQRKEKQLRRLKEASEDSSAGLDVMESQDDSENDSVSDGNAEDVWDSTMCHACGTYSVKEIKGLVVLPFDPNRSHHGSSDAEEDNLSLTHSNSILDGADLEGCHRRSWSASADFDLAEEKKVEVELDSDSHDNYPLEPFVVEHGNMVQIVDITDDGVYKLARNKGFIVASADQIVKVGAPQDASCKLEGMRAAAQAEQRAIQKRLQKMEKICQNLKEDIKLEQQQCDGANVIRAPLHDEDNVNDTQKQDASTVGTIKQDKPSSPVASSTLTAPMTPTAHSCTPERTPEVLHLSSSSYSTEIEIGGAPRMHNHLHSPAHSCPMPLDTTIQPYLDVNQRVGLPAYRISTDDDLSGLQIGFGCGTSLFGERLLEESRGNGQHEGNENYMSLSFDDGSLAEDRTLRPRTVSVGTYSRRLSNGGMSNSSQIHRIGPTTPINPAHVLGEDPVQNYANNATNPNSTPISLQSSSFDGAGVNWRTGMSGHRGLSSTRKKNVNSPSNRRSVRFMSVHRGAAAPPQQRPHRPHHQNQQQLFQYHQSHVQGPPSIRSAASSAATVL